MGRQAGTGGWKKTRAIDWSSSPATERETLEGAGTGWFAVCVARYRAVWRLRLASLPSVRSGVANKRKFVGHYCDRCSLLSLLVVKLGRPGYSTMTELTVTMRQIAYPAFKIVEEIARGSQQRKTTE